MINKKPVSCLEAIYTYFGAFSIEDRDSMRKEVARLNKDERNELGRLAAEELGMELVLPQ